MVIYRIFIFVEVKKNIYTWDGREVKDFFSKPALQQIEENIQNLSYKNLEQQTQYIKITFNMENAGTRKIKNKRLKLDLYIIIRGWEKRESRIAKYERRMGGKV